MTDLEIFLLARIEECEKAAAGEHLWSCTTITHALPCDCGLPARVLAECVSKRRIMNRWGGKWADDPTLKMLAAVYSDHPDWREEWTPWDGVAEALVRGREQGLLS